MPKIILSVTEKGTTVVAKDGETSIDLSSLFVFDINAELRKEKTGDVLIAECRVKMNTN